ncbi:hypothetical protein H0H92_016033 [Tricholoma furcatifolium]|nr:hypothetical protein H0H92_016033 [Tricholoma furcatifolium]
MAATSASEVTKAARTLIVCFDGTANEYSGVDTNIIKFFALLKKDDFNQQLCYYQPGIGTWFSPGVVSPLFRWGAKVLDEAFAWYLDAHVIQGYKFLMQNYRVGDKICFSRGSYTARSLAGLLYKCGLLPRDNEQQIPFAYKLYKREDRAGHVLAAGFKQTFCQDVKIEFVGVWDTVASVGVITARTLPFTNSNRAIKTFRHALSLDERRAKFLPNFYHRPSPAAKPPVEEEPLPPSGSLRSLKKFFKGNDTVGRMFKKSIQLLLEDPEPEDDVTPKTDVREVWFSGTHGDVGGGCVADTEPRSLANISLRWMVRQVQQSNCGIQFDDKALERAGISPFEFTDEEMKDPDFNVADATREAEADNDVDDAVDSLHDQLIAQPLWWILELLPTSFTWQDDAGYWHRRYRINAGKGRRIPDPKPLFHETVRTRMRIIGPPQDGTGEAKHMFTEITTQYDAHTLTLNTTTITECSAMNGG